MTRRSTTPRPRALTPEELAREVIKRIADKRTWLVLELLARNDHKFSDLHAGVEEVNQKDLLSTLRQLERDGLVVRRMTSTRPPRVDYKLTALGQSLAEAFGGVWLWAKKHHLRVSDARKKFDDVRNGDLAIEV